MQRRIVEAGFPGDQLIIDDVPQAPRPAQPGLQIIPRTLARVIAKLGLEDLVGSYFDRRSQSRARRFRQDPDSTVKALIMPRRRPEIIRGMDGNSGLTS